MKLIDTKYFKVEEFIHSETAEKLGIDNTPTDNEIIENIQYTMEYLNKVREEFGEPIYVNSGYRCKALNEAVGGSKNSYHMTGLAVDLRWNPKLFDFMMSNCHFDKLIREKSKKTFWIHVQLKRNPEEEQNKIIYMTVK